LLQNYPLQLFNPQKPLSLSLTPLVAEFPTKNGGSGLAVIVADPEGGLSGFDFDGNQLPDFPLAVGDTILAPPAILDIDGDGDIELVCISEDGVVYVWDFSTSLDATQPYKYWTQVNANEMNQNRHAPNQVGAILPEAAKSTLLPKELVYNWPNPNQGNYTFIRYRLNTNADVKIKIFDLAGDLIKELNGSGNSNTDNEVRWDLTNVQSGVYLARIEANSQGRKEAHIIKIAVVK